ncbi:hypothetical protein PFISCL1PPCAC_23910 [Pristionchus fissidentatus]|uniref:MSP domain-containing protein n=1 Tax=Pristionchus fissidentatus TaxID=1538716 RepID=A0AAV5WML4_9BILA|nr:hypothetical protein PFISCL1PPCAC_23910 [Pristionchus fissidentatus]
MASLIARDVVPTYVSPAVVMYLRDEGPLRRVEDVSSDEEDDQIDKKKESKRDSRSSNGATYMKRREGGVGGTRASFDKRGEDSAYSSIGGSTMMDNDDCASTTSSIPVDPSTQVPVFLVPSDMEFVVAGDSPDTRKVLTLYNPYEYAFQFRILCTAPEYYTLQKPNGIVGAKRVVEIPIRGLPTLMPSMMHRIKVEIRRLGQNELLGSRIVTMRSVAFASPLSSQEGGQGVFHRMGGVGGSGVRGERGMVPPDVRIEPAPAAPPVNLSLMIVVSALCLLALCLPIQKDTTQSVSMIPNYLHISETQRVVAAFILGVCSVLILQPANR